MSRGVEKTALQAASLFGLILCVLTGIWAWQAGLLTSQERLQAFVASCGAAGGLLFVAYFRASEGGAIPPDSETRQKGHPKKMPLLMAGPVGVDIAS